MCSFWKLKDNLGFIFTFTKLQINFGCLWKKKLLAWSALKLYIFFEWNLINNKPITDLIMLNKCHTIKLH